MTRELDRRRDYIAFLRKLQSGEDAIDPRTCALVRGLGNDRPGDIGYGGYVDNWNDIEEVIEFEEEQLRKVEAQLIRKGRLLVLPE